MRELIQLPDCKNMHEWLTLGKQYEVLRVIENGSVIQTNNPDIQVLLLSSRLQNVDTNPPERV